MNEYGIITKTMKKYLGNIIVSRKTVFIRNISYQRKHYKINPLTKTNQHQYYGSVEVVRIKPNRKFI